MKKNKKANKMKPINYIAVFILTTILLYFMNPVQYETRYPFVLAMLVVFYVIMLYMGYWLGMLVKRKRKLPDNCNYGGDKYIFYLYAGLVYTIVQLAVSLNRIGSVSNAIATITYALQNMNETYQSKYIAAESSTLLNVFTMFGYYTQVIALSYGTVYFGQLKIYQKVILCITIVATVLRWLIIGTNKGIFEVVVYFVVAYFISRVRRAEQPKKHCMEETCQKRANRIQLVALAASAVAFIFIYGEIIDGRIGSSIDTLQRYSLARTTLDQNSWIFRLLPQSIAVLLLRVIGYLTHGYYGMSLALTLDWQPMFFMGSSQTVTNWAQRILGSGFTERAYRTRIAAQYGWSETVKWSTAYTELANDFGFIGVGFVMLLMGYLLYRVIDDVSHERSIYAIALLYMLILAISYSSMVNVLGNSYQMIGFIILLVLWNRSNKVRRNKY